MLASHAGEGGQYGKNTNIVNKFVCKSLPPAFIATTIYSKDNDIERAICEASLAMDLDPRLKATVAVREFKALYRRLLNRRKGIPRSTSRGGHNKKLREPQNTTIKSYLEILYHCGKAAN
jgi:hypothetical protein